MTLQEMFNRSYLGVLSQGRKSHNGPRCLYSHDGAHCAIGWLLPEPIAHAWDNIPNGHAGEVQSFSFIHENQSEVDHAFWRDHARDDLDSLGIDTDEATVAFLAKLQLAHDGWNERLHGSFLDYFTDQMSFIAADYGLTIPETFHEL